MMELQQQNKSVTPIEQEAAQSVMGMLKKYGNSIKGALPASMDRDRFAWLVVNSIRTTPKLAECTPASFINAVMLASNVGVEIRRNSAYLIPYGKECQLLIDYRGKMDLARKSGTGNIAIELVREYDVFEFERTSKGSHFRHVPSLLKKDGGRLIPVASTGEVVLGYGMADVGKGEPQIEVMTLEQIETIRRRAKSGAGVPFSHYGRQMPGLTLEEIRQKDPATMGFKDPYRLPWVTDWDQMARKTIMHRLANYLPQSNSLVLSQEIDDAADTGKPMPIAEQLEAMMAEIDPAHNRPMIDIPEETAQRTEAQLAIVAAKTGMKTFDAWGDIEDPIASELGLTVQVGGKNYTRSTLNESWTEQKRK